MTETEWIVLIGTAPLFAVVLYWYIRALSGYDQPSRVMRRYQRRRERALQRRRTRAP